jgi:hypothetical protein
MKKELTYDDRIVELNRYEDAYMLLTEALQHYPREMWMWKPAPEKWSIHEILIHITDSEVNSYIRCRRFIAENGSAVLGYDQDAWCTNLVYHNQPIYEMLDLFRLLRSASARLIRRQPVSIWKNKVVHSEIGEITMDEWLQIYADHIPVHIAQMNRNLEAWNMHTTK